MAKRVTKELFLQLKRELESTSVQMIAFGNGLSEKTVLQVKGSKNFADYQAQVKAQHPPVKNSMRDTVAEINEKLERIESMITGIVK